MPKACAVIKMPLEREEFNRLCIKCLKKVPYSRLSKEGDVFYLKESMGFMTFGVRSEIIYKDNTVTINSKSGGFGHIQSSHVKEYTDIIKGLLMRGLRDPKHLNDPDVVRCPKCGSRQIVVVKRGWTFTTGFIGSGENERVCKNCMYKF